MVFLLFYSISTSPLFAFEGLDSAIFQEVGLVTTHGKVLYRDILDNKGPILYWINGLGMTIGGTNGILLLQILFQSVTLYYLFCIARLFVNGLYAFVATLLTLAYYSFFILEGNQCEEWMLPLVCISIYTGLRHLLFSSKNNSYKDGFVIGLCFSGAFFIRPNDAIAMIGGVVIGIAIENIINRQWKEFLKIIASFIIGFAIITIPILIYFGINNSISDFIYGIWSINIGYTGGGLGLLKGFISDTGAWLLLIIMITACVMLYNTNEKKVLWIMIPIALLESIAFGRSYFLHYYIIILPIYMIIFTTLFAVKNKSLVFLALLIVTCTPVSCSYRIAPKKAIALGLNQLKILSNNYYYDYGDILQISEDDMKENMLEIERLGSIIPLKERDSVWNYNLIEYGTCKHYLNYVFFAHNNIVQMNRMTFPLSENVDPDPTTLSSPPLWIIIAASNPNVKNRSFIKKYQLIDYITAINGEVQLYRRK